jgi:hypothetical protein
MTQRRRWPYRLGRLAMAVGLCAGGSALLGTTAAHAAGAPPGIIGYQCQPEGSCAVGSDGSDPHVTLDDPARVPAATPSPDGTREAYITSDPSDQHRSLWVASATGADPTAVWTLPGLPFGPPVWRPDGNALAMTLQVASSADQIWVVGADGSAAHQVATAVDGSPPAWSPDGQRLTYVSGVPAPFLSAPSALTLEVIPAAGGPSTVLAAIGGTSLGLSSTSWSPAGRILIVDLESIDEPPTLVSSVKSIPATGGTPAVVLGARTEYVGDYGPAYYSPDGSQFAVELNGSNTILVANADGTGVHTIASGSSTITGWSAQPSDQAGLLAAGSPGYHLVASDGGVFSFHTPFYGSTGGIQLNQPIVGMAETPDGKGYWLAARDGGVFSFGDAVFFGSPFGHITAPIVGIAPDRASGGYVLAGADGNVYPFNAPDLGGSLVGQHLDAPIVGIAVSPGSGYWLAAADGGVFNFGTSFYGSAAGFKLDRPIVGITADLATGGYWLVAADGGVFSFNAPFFGSTGAIHLNQPIVGITADLTTGGYWLVAADGGVFSFNAPFFGSTGAIHLNQPMVAIAANDTAVPV